MNLRIALLLPFAAMSLLLPGCAGNQRLSQRDRAAIHRVTVDPAIDSQSPSTDDVSQVAWRILGETGTDAGKILAGHMERELARNGFTVDRKTPDATFHFALEKLTMNPADDLKLRHRPVLGMRSTLLDKDGRRLWSHSASVVAERSSALTWHEYAFRPQQFRAEFDKLAARIAAHFVAELKR